MGDMSHENVLMAGYAKGSILPDGQLHLIGMYSRTPRVGSKLRDEIMVRAVSLSLGDHRIVLAACDLLCVSEELTRAVSKCVQGLEPHELILAATHTHSSFGGFFPSNATSAMLGEPSEKIFNTLAGRIAKVVSAALDDLQPATMRTGQAQLPGLTASRRQADGPFDDDVFLICLDRKGRRPIHVMSCSGHPVVVSEREPHSISSDYPGMVCRALQEQGYDSVFFSSALGGVSILFPEFKMDADRHLDLLKVLLMEAHSRAEAASSPVLLGDEPGMTIEKFYVPHGPHSTKVFSPIGTKGKVADLALAPVLGRLRKAGIEGLANPSGIYVHSLRIGNWVFVACAAEMGVTMVRAVRELARHAGVDNPMVISLAGGYAGYMHLENIYKRVPEKGYRYMAYYENALALFGFEMGEKVLQEIRRRFG